jgi:F-type H+-transporting ATPase subunit a
MHEESIQEIIEKGIRPLVQFHLGAKEYSLSNIFFASLLAAVIFCLVIVLFGIAAKSKKPSRMQYVGELLYMMLKNFVTSKLGKKAEPVVPFIGTLFGYMLISNLLGLFSPLGQFGLHFFIAPTIDLSITLAMATVGIAYVHFRSMQLKGIKHYFSHYFKPYPWMFPINLIEEFVKPLSLAVRLFGNIFGEHVVFEITFSLVSFAVPVLVMFLTLFTGSVQTYVFSLLIMVYLTEMIGLHEEGSHS